MGRRVSAAAAASAALTLAACASTPPSMQHGVAAFHAGRNQEAARYFVQCSSEGVPECMYNLGYMFESRRLPSTNPRADAIRWYVLAARHAEPDARVALTRLGAPVPPPDLAPAPYQPTPEEMDAASALGELVGTAIGGGFRR